MTSIAQFKQFFSFCEALINFYIKAPSKYNGIVMPDGNKGYLYFSENTICTNRVKISIENCTRVDLHRAYSTQPHGKCLISLQTFKNFNAWQSAL